jgi:hypothetical protein
VILISLLFMFEMPKANCGDSAVLAQLNSAVQLYRELKPVLSLRLAAIASAGKGVFQGM